MNNIAYKIGISTTVDYSVNIEKQLELFNKYQFDFVSVGGYIDHSRIDYPDEFENVMKLASSFGISIDSFHLPFKGKVDVASESKSKRDNSIIIIRDYLSLVSENCIPIAVLHPHHYFDNRDSCLKNAIESLEKILDDLPSNVRLVVENLPTADGSLICSSILDRFPDKLLGFCYDSSHENMSGPPFHLLKNYYSRLTTTHLSDNHGASDEHLIPGEGSINWLQLKNYIDQSGLNQILFEIGTGESLNTNLDDFIEKARKSIDSIFGN